MSKVLGSPSTKNKSSDRPKAEVSYTPAPAMVRLSKPAHYREVAITDKTGGCNNEAGVVERMFAQAPKGNASKQRETGGAVLTTKPTS